MLPLFLGVYYLSIESRERCMYDTMQLDGRLGGGKAGLASIKAILLR
jgi:hypothetical protein